MKKLEKYWSALNGCSFIEAKQSKEYYWYCGDGRHYFTAKYSNLMRSSNCPYCGGGRFMEGVNDLKTFNKDIDEDWSYRNNTSPVKVHHNSPNKFYFNCGVGHEYYMSAKSYSAGVQCPKCSGRLSDGFNSLEKVHPVIAKDWDSEKNAIAPHEVASSSGKKFWWRCFRGHELWEGVQLRVTKNGCSHCNSFIYSHPELYSKYSVNNSINPLTLTAGSSKKVEWCCDVCGVSHWDTIKNKVNGRGCGVCAGRIIMAGVNDLGSRNRELAKYYSKSNVRGVREVYYKSNLYCDWHCKDCDYSWREKPVRNKYCPKCSPKFRSNFEKEVWRELKEIFEDYELRNNYSKLRGFKDVDFYLPELKLIIECNGDYWHSNENIMKRLGVSSLEYHTGRFRKAGGLGLTILYVWESDWSNNKSLVLEGFRLFRACAIVHPIFGKFSSNIV